MSPQRAEDATPGLAHCGAEPGDDADLLRHARHLMLPGWGFEAQSQLRAAHALVIGAGGLGSPALMYLAAAGVGTLSVVDADSVELSNLQRQILHRQGDLGRLKVDSARRGLLELNPNVTVHTWAQRADSAWLEATVPKADVVLDCSDNFQTRQAVNAACRRHGKVLVSASALGWAGQVSVFGPDGPCYACLFPPEHPPGETRCATLGVFSPLVGLMGSLQATEALRWLGQRQLSLTGRLLQVDARDLQWQDIRLSRRQGCPVCSH